MLTHNLPKLHATARDHLSPGAPHRLPRQRLRLLEGVSPAGDVEPMGTLRVIRREQQCGFRLPVASIVGWSQCAIGPTC